MYGRLLYKSMVACFIVPPALELVHIGKKEIQQRIDSIEAAYSQPITWSASADSAVPSSQWGDNILVVGESLTPRLFRSTVSDTTVPSSMWTWGWSTTPTHTILLQVGRLFVSLVICTGRTG